MIRDTSIEVFRQIESEGLLSRLRFEVYSFLYKNGPMTCRELMLAMMRGKSFVIAGGSLSTRFSELERIGVIKNIGVRTCRESGRIAIEWDVTSKLPLKLEKPARHKCKSCGGKGYLEETQTRMF